MGRGATPEIRQKESSPRPQGPPNTRGDSSAPNAGSPKCRKNCSPGEDSADHSPGLPPEGRSGRPARPSGQGGLSPEGRVTALSGSSQGVPLQVPAPGAPCLEGIRWQEVRAQPGRSRHTLPQLKSPGRAVQVPLCPSLSLSAQETQTRSSGDPRRLSVRPPTPRPVARSWPLTGEAAGHCQ